jgi:tripartite ATP-independent transporter DctM subunit
LNAAILVGTFIVLLVLGTPIAIGLGLASLIYLVFLSDIPLLVISHRLASSLEAFTVMAIPFFILAGTLMNTGGITKRLVKLAMKTVGHITGALGHTTVVTNMIMAGMSGSAVADAAGTGMILIKAMTDEGYEPKTAAGIVAASATIGPIIPPSIPMVLYGAMAGASVGALFIGGVVPGVLMGLSLMILMYFIARKRGYPRYKRATMREWLVALKEASLALGLPILIIGGILGGFFTPTEAASVAAIYAVILGLFVYKEFGWKDLPRILDEAVTTTAVVMFIFVMATIFAWLMSVEKIPELASDAILGVSRSPRVVLLILNIALLIAGCLLDPTPILLITVPVLAPMIAKVGIDPIHFGVVMVLNLMIGLLTPPVGMNLYVVSRIAKISFWESVKGAAPFIVPLMVVLILITYIPDLVLWLPRLIFF